MNVKKGGNDLFASITCSILGKDESDPVLQKLRSFKNNVLLCDKQYIDEFSCYNTLEPRVIDYLVNEKNRELAQHIYDEFLVKISELISRKEYLMVVDGYRILVKWLIEYCGLTSEFNRLSRINSCGGNEKTRQRMGRRKFPFLKIDNIV